MKRRAFLFGAASISFAPSIADAFQSNAEYVLADILLPRSDALGGPEKFADAAATEFDRLMAARDGVVATNLGADRWGRSVVRAVAGAEDVAKRLVAGGYARVNPQSDDVAYIDGLLAVETDARTRGAGLWRLPDYQVVNANTGKPRQNVFNLFEGLIAKADKFEGRVFLNFGEDFRTDITATIASRDARKWKIVPEEIQGQRVRVRGFTEWINGPSLQLFHRQALEFIGDD